MHIQVKCSAYRLHQPALIVSVFMLICSFLPGARLGAQNVWTGLISTDWEDSANWTGGVPSTADSVIIPNEINQPLIMTGTMAFAMAIQVQSGAVLIIQSGATLEVSGPAGLAAIEVYGGILNYGLINIGTTGVSHSLGVGVYSNAGFINYAGAEINIENNFYAGIENFGTFINQANITIGETNSSRTYGIRNFAAFNNNSTGDIRIDYTTGEGLFNTGSGTFTNAGQLTIGALAGVGENTIRNDGAFFNNSGGEISLDNSSIRGIWNIGTFTNTAKITIGATGSTGQYAIESSLAFNNSGCSALLVTYGPVYTSYGAFDNSGSIIEYSSDNSNISSNSGVVQNLNGGTFTIGSGSGLLTTTTGSVWTGCADTDWDNALNWIDLNVPGSTDDVTIPDVTNDPVIGSATAAEVHSVVVEVDGALTIQNAASLSINGWVSHPIHGAVGLVDLGTVNNNGLLQIGNTGNVGITGLYNDGIFNNNAGAELHVDRSSIRGIRNRHGNFVNAGRIIIGANAGVGQMGIQDSWNFTNEETGEIEIDNSSNSGLDFQGINFLNYGKITIGSKSSVGTYGIYDLGHKFVSFPGAEIRIDRCSGAGIFNKYVSSNWFDNSGKIIIGADASVGMYGIRNESEFDNNGELEINNASQAGIYNYSSKGLFYNRGKLTIGSLSGTGQYGIRNAKTFYNFDDGEIRIDRSTLSGVYNEAETFTNTGLIILGANNSPGDHGLFNQGTFNNNAGGDIRIDRTGDIGLYNDSGPFSNSGKIAIGSQAAVGYRALYNIEAVFNNNADGEIELNNSSLIGLDIKRDGAAPTYTTQFHNWGKLYIGNLSAVGARGIDLVRYTRFRNYAGAEVTIDRTTSYGFLDEGDVRNESVMTIGALGSMSGNSIYFNYSFVNASCAVLTVFAPIYEFTSYGLNNQGYFIVNTTAAHTNLSIFRNSGVISYPQGNPIGGNLDNTGMILAPASGECPIADALQIGAGNHFTAGATWYTDEDLTSEAGTYDQGANTFAPATGLSQGTHTLYLNAHDDDAGCDHTVAIRLTYNDVTPPNITCPSNTTVTPTNNNPCTAIVNGIDATYGDNCNPSLGYTRSGATGGGGNGQASGQTFNTGTTTVTYQVTDGANLTNTCSFTVTVSACAGLTISGAILWEHDGTSGVNTTTVNVTGSGTGSGTSGTNGNYSVNVPVGSGNFTVTPSKNINKLNGLTSADVTAIQQHVANITLLPAPYKRIAADVNKSNTITTLDASLIQQALQGNSAALNQITSWRFVPASYTFPNPNVPWGFPENIALTGVSGNVTGQNFKGVKLGDVVSTWANPANLTTAKPLVFSVQDQMLETGAEAVADFHAGALADLASFQAALYFDPSQLELVQVEPLNGLSVSMNNFGLFNVAEGEIRIVWAQAAGRMLSENTPAFRLRFRALDGGVRLSEVLQIDESVLPAHSYNSAFAEAGVDLRFTEATDTQTAGNGPSFDLLASPNPFAGHTTLSFTLPEAGEAELRVRDAAGRVLFFKKDYYAAGAHRERLEPGDATAGVLFVELVSGAGKATQRLVCVR